MVEACVYYSLIGCLDPGLAFNDGIRDVVRLILAPRRITNSAPPAPVSNYQMVNRRLIDSSWRRWPPSIRHAPSPTAVRRAYLASPGCGGGRTSRVYNMRSSAPVRPMVPAWGATGHRRQPRI